MYFSGGRAAQLLQNAQRKSLSQLWLPVRTWLIGYDSEGVSPRGSRKIIEQCRANEVIVGWVQMTLVATFALLYTLSRKTFPPGTVQPVPWALGTYAVFTLWRLRLAHVGRLSHSMMMLSILADMTVLMVTIWSFHLQYAQPPAFYLKAPTMLYVFIFIGLRVLSFAPGYVLFAGLVAAVGWLAMLGYALLDGGIALVTHDYVAYMTSARILIGGEVDKVVSILMVTAILTIAAARARTLLFRSVSEHEAAARLSRFFSPEVADRILGDDSALAVGHGAQIQAAAMFIDMRGFTRLAADRSPPEVIALLGEYLDIAVPTIHAHGGSITTFLGDGIMVTFGATRRSASCAADALRAAEALLRVLGSWAEVRTRSGKPAPGVGIGVDIGIVTRGAIGHEGRLEYAVIGDPVNRAAKLQAQTKIEGVGALATARALERALEQGYTPARPPEMRRARPVAGIAEPVDLAVIG